MQEEIKSKFFLKEIKSQIRQEKMFSFLKKNKKTILYISIFLALFILLICAFSWYKDNQSIKYSAMLHQAIIDKEEGNIEKSIKILEEIYNSKAPIGVKSLASLHYGSILLEENKLQEAFNIYKNISQEKENNIDQYLKEYAGLMAIRVLISANDNEKYQQAIDLAQDLQKSSSVLKYHIIEQQAIAYLSLGKKEKAAEIFNNLSSNPEISDNLKRRIADFASIYKVAQ